MPFTKIHSKWITDLNVKCKIIKILESGIRKNLGDLGFSVDTLGTSPKT